MASAFDIAASGMAAHRAEMDLIAENLANAGASRADGTQFRPRSAVFASGNGDTFATALDSALGGEPTSLAGLDDMPPADFALAFSASGGDDGGIAGHDSDFFGDDEPQPVRLAGIVEARTVTPAAGNARAADALELDNGVDSIGQMVSLVAAGRAYDGDVAAFLEEAMTTSGTVFGGIRRLSDAQAARLSPTEWDVMIRLAIEREPIGLADLASGMAPTIGRSTVVEALESLRRRSLVERGERRIPVQYAKRVVGRRMMGGQSTHLPLKVNAGGVIPIIFASSLLALPQTALQFPVVKNRLWLSSMLGALGGAEARRQRLLLPQRRPPQDLLLRGREERQQRHQRRRRMVPAEWRELLGAYRSPAIDDLPRLHGGIGILDQKRHPRPRRHVDLGADRPELRAQVHQWDGACCRGHPTSSETGLAYSAPLPNSTIGIERPSPNKRSPMFP